MSRIFGAVAALSALALGLSACTSATGEGDRRTTPGTTPAARPASATPSPTSVLVPASRSKGVQVLPLPTRYRGTSGFSLQADTAPDPMRLDRPNTVHFEFYNDDPQKADVGLTGIATNGALVCGSPFAAPPGHGYRVTCTFTPSSPKGRIGISYADPLTGAAKGTKVTIPFTAR